MIAWLHALVHGVTVREAITSTVDILVVAYLVYRGLLLVKGTRAAQMLTGLVLVAVGFYLARVFEQVKGRPLYLFKQTPARRRAARRRSAPVRGPAARPRRSPRCSPCPRRPARSPGR